MSGREQALALARRILDNPDDAPNSDVELVSLATALVSRTEEADHLRSIALDLAVLCGEILESAGSPGAALMRRLELVLTSTAGTQS